jgi:hypothetical protein
MLKPFLNSFAFIIFLILYIFIIDLIFGIIFDYLIKPFLNWSADFSFFITVLIFMIISPILFRISDKVVSINLSKYENYFSRFRKNYFIKFTSLIIILIELVSFQIAYFNEFINKKYSSISLLFWIWFVIVTSFMITLPVHTIYDFKNFSLKRYSKLFVSYITSVLILIFIVIILWVIYDKFI